MGGAACAKIRINGIRSIATIGEIVKAAEMASETGEPLGNDEQIIVYFNEIENIADKAAIAYLEGQGYTGPLPHSLDVKA